MANTRERLLIEIRIAKKDKGGEESVKEIF